MEQIILRTLAKNNVDSFMKLSDLEIVSGKKISKDSVFILLKGYVDIVSKNGAEKNILHRIHPTDNKLCNILPFMDKEYDTKDLHLSFSRDSVVAATDSDRFKALIKKPSFLKHLYLNLNTFICDKLKEDESMRRLNGEQKITRFLLKYSTNNQYQVWNYSDLAKVLKTDRNYVYKVIWKLEEEALIKKSGNTLFIEDRERLTESYAS